MWHADLGYLHQQDDVLLPVLVHSHLLVDYGMAQAGEWQLGGYDLGWLDHPLVPMFDLGGENNDHHDAP
jgi:hypothetical protein